MKTKIITAFIAGSALLTGCGGSDKKDQEKLESGDAILFPTQATQGAIDAVKAREGEYALRSFKIYTEHGSTKLLYSLEVKNPGDLSKDSDELKVKTAWPEPSEDEEEGTVNVHTLQWPLPLKLTSQSSVLSFDREALINLQASSDGKVDWSPGDQIRTNVATVMGSLFSSGAIKEALVYRLLGQEGIAVEKADGVVFYIKSEDKDSKSVAEINYVRTGDVKAAPVVEKPKTPSGTGGGFVANPVSAAGKQDTKYVRCTTSTHEFFASLGSALTTLNSFDLKIGVRSLGTNDNFRLIASPSFSLARVSGADQIYIGSGADNIFVVTEDYKNLQSGGGSDASVNSGTAAISSCLFLQNNIYSGKYNF